MMKTALLSLICAACFGFASAAPAASGGKGPAIPDFTQGDAVPATAKHDWNLGPTGLRGWMFCDQMVTTDARQVAITAVDQGSPADGLFAVGDVLLGAGGKPFSFDPRTELGRAITAAETEAGGGRLALARWRAGQTSEVVLKLSVLGSFSATAPYDCPKSRRILAQGLQTLAARVAEADYAEQHDAIPRSLNALALLAGGEAAHLPLVKREARWAADFTTPDFKTWYYGYVMIFLAEYITATDDASVLPGLRRLAMEAAGGQSAVGSLGHTFALPDGRLQGYGMMNAPGLPLTIGMVLARDAGVKDAEVACAIELSARLLRFYTGKGTVPYGDHPAWTETHEDNGKCGMAAVLFNRLGEAKSADYFTRMAVASHGSERDCGHTGNYFNLLWSLPAIIALLDSASLDARHPTASSHDLFRALRGASQVMPLTTRFFWGDIDLKWYPEACLSHPKSKGFYTVRHFMEGSSMPGAEVLCIRDWRTRLTGGQSMQQTTPLEIANALETAVAETFASLETLREAARKDSELQKTVNDCESLAWLGRYYAAKIRGACTLAVFDANGDKSKRDDALRHLGDALSHWKKYAAIRDAHYVPALYNRVGYVDVTALTEKVAADIEIARNWKPSTLRDDGKRSGTERGFRK